MPIVAYDDGELLATLNSAFARLWFIILASALVGAIVWLGFGVLRRHRRRKARRDGRRD